MNRNFTFRELVFFYFIIGIVEIVIRIVWDTTPLPFLFATLTVFMYLNIAGASMSLKDRWYLFFPFVISSVQFGLFFLGKNDIENSVLWTQFFTIGYVIFTPVFLFPVLLKAQRVLQIGDNRRKIILFHFLAILQLIAVFFRFITILYPGDDEFTLNELENYSLQSFLFVGILSCAYHLITTKGKSEKNILLVTQMENYKAIIIDFFVIKKRYLLTDMSLSKLALETKIDKEDLEVFFNEYIGQDFHSFITEYRITNALKMINESGNKYTIDYIASKSGFKNRSTFSKHFKKIIGVLPSDYIKNLKKKE